MGEDPLGDVWQNPLVKKEFQLQLPSGTQSMFLLSLWGGAQKNKINKNSTCSRHRHTRQKL